MDRANEAVGGASAIPIDVDDESVSALNNLQSWDASHADI